MKLEIRPARPEEAATLSELAVRSKSHWGYETRDVLGWLPDLTVAAAEVAERPSFAAELGGTLAGFCQVAAHGSRAELVHLSVEPQFMGRGVGRALLDRALEAAAEAGARELAVDADPNAERLFRAAGARLVRHRRAPVAGDPDRTRPQLVIDVTPARDTRPDGDDRS